MSLQKPMIAEFLGTAGLLIVVVGSGIMGENLANGNMAIALLANSLATGFGLFVLIECFQSISGAHFNPVVTLYEWLTKKLDKNRMFAYWLAQITGAIVGVWITHVMFGLQIIQVSTKERLGFGLGVSELIATFGLILTITLVGRNRTALVPVSVAAYIAGAYWFTSSTSFANPAVTIARMFTDTFCGIAPSGVGLFIAGQILGVLVAYGIKTRILTE